MSFAAMLAACGSSGSTTHTVTGMLHTATSHTVASSPSSCAASGFDDIRARGGTEILIKNAKGKTIGQAAVGAGQDGGSITGGPNPQKTFLACQFPFTIAKVPESGSYTLVIGAHSCQFRWTVADMKAKGWRIDPSLNESYYTGATECLGP